MDKNKKSPLAEKIITLRKAKGLTQSQTAELLGVQRSTYAYYECSTTPPLVVLRRMAKLFDTTVDSLVGTKGYTGYHIPENLEPTYITLNQEPVAYQVTPSPDRLSSEDKIFFTRYQLLPPELKQKAQEFLSKLVNEIDK